MSQPASSSNPVSPISPTSPYRECLGAAFADMPAVLQQFHGPTGDFIATGRVTVTAAKNPLARLVAWLMGAPTRDGEGPFKLERRLLAAESAETWTRSFPGHRFHSTICARQGLLIESMGPFSATSRVVWHAPYLRLELIGVRFFGIPAPRWLLPRLVAEEHAEGNRLHFNIDTQAPWVGRLFAYRGSLEITP